ncbi:MAG: serine/threonine protein kinase [Deltaproteobacteria bacterium]|nr:serine/threonine protein kinase [Deltaproteobacteria bacterium]
MADSQRPSAAEATQRLPRSGRTIGRYRVVRLLGEGTMGRVYLAHDPELGRDVAVKVLRLEAAGAARDAYIARFRNEARAAARFNHPNVVSVHDVGVDQHLGPYVVYEYVPGSNLRPRLQRGPLDREALVHVARSVAWALDALHAARIVHRDIKPDNILLGGAGQVKLTDFGIARVPEASLTRDGQFLGTPAYAPPEAILRAEYSPRGDVFSLAAVTYEALTGARAFPGDEIVAVSYAVVHDTPPPPSKHRPQLGPAVDAVFVKGLAKRAEDRFDCATAFAEALAEALGVPRESPPVVVLQKNGGPHPADVAPVLVAAVLLVALVVVLARNLGDREAQRAPEPSGEGRRALVAPRTAPVAPRALARRPQKVLRDAGARAPR